VNRSDRTRARPVSRRGGCSIRAAKLSLRLVDLFGGLIPGRLRQTLTGRPAGPPRRGPITTARPARSTRLNVSGALSPRGAPEFLARFEQPEVANGPTECLIIWSQEIAVSVVVEVA
jgi:hypothetical protein